MRSLFLEKCAMLQTIFLPLQSVLTGNNKLYFNHY